MRWSKAALDKAALGKAALGTLVGGGKGRTWYLSRYAFSSSVPRTRAIFDHVFGLPALDGSRAGYALSYAEAPNAMDAAVEAARSAREARSLAAYAATARRVRTLGDLHAFLFFDHAAYAASRLLKPPEPLDAAALRSY